MNIYVEHLKFKPKSNIDKIYRDQKLKSAPCRHLQKLKEVEHLDFKNDETITLIHCEKCDAIMSDKMLAIRKDILNKFKKVK